MDEQESRYKTDQETKKQVKINEWMTESTK